MKYTVIMDKDLKVVEEQVNELIKEGYVPASGLCMNGDEFVQSMFRTILEVDVERHGDTIKWDNFASVCENRKGMACMKEEKMCSPGVCPLENKPEVTDWSRYYPQMSNMQK